MPSIPFDNPSWLIARKACTQSVGGMVFKSKSDPAKWAETKRFLSPGVSWAARSKAIRYQFNLSPPMREATADVVHPDVQLTVWQMASDLGKTEAGNNIIGFCMDEEPSKIIVLYPIELSAQTWSKDSLAKMIEDTPTLKAKVHEAKSRDSGNTISHKSYPGGSISVLAGGSVNNFRLRRARLVVGDEIDALKGEVGNEGDPISLLLKRTEGYEDSIQLLMGTPTMRGSSRIEWWFNLSDKNYYFCPCKKCGLFQTLKWSQVNWKDHDNDPRKTRYHCERVECDYPHTDAERVEMIHNGKWQATAPFNGIRGRHLNGIYSIFPAKKGFVNKLHQMAWDAIMAKRGETPRFTVKVWTNTFLAETFVEDADRVEVHEATEHQEDFEDTERPDQIILPEGVLVLTAGVDVQGDRIEAELLGTGLDDETWGIEKAIFPGAPTGKAVWGSLDTWLMKRYRHALGAEMKIACTLIDQGHVANIVKKFCRARRMRRIYPCRGSNILGMPLVTLSKKKAGLVNVGTETAKEEIYASIKLKKEEMGPGYAHFNSEKFGYTQEHFKQLTSEYAETVYSKGHRVRRFVCPPNTRNEALDIRVYAKAAVSVLNPNWEALRKNLEKAGGKSKDEPDEQTQDPTAEAQPPRERKRRPVDFNNYQIKTW